MVVESLTVDFTDTLWASHDVGWVDGFVGGDHDELLSAVLHGKVSNDARTIDIVADCLTRVVLHHGHVLVSCCMEDVLRHMLGENLLHVILIGYAWNDGEALEVFMVVGHKETHIVHRGLCLIDKYEFGWLELSHLTRHLATDGACCSGDEDALALEHCAYGFHIDLDLLARKEVFDLYFLELIVREVWMAVPFFCLWHHHNLDVGLDEGINKGGAVGEAFWLYRRHEEYICPLFLHILNNLVGIVIDLGIKKPWTVKRLVTRNESGKMILTVDRVLDAFGKSNSSAHTTIDEYSFRGFWSAVSIVQSLY